MHQINESLHFCILLAAEVIIFEVEYYCSPKVSSDGGADF